MEILLFILGAIMIYAWIHYAVVSHKKEYNKRTTYEKVVTWTAIITFVLFFIGSSM